MKLVKILIFTAHLCLIGRNNPFSNPFEVTQNINLIGIAKSSNCAATIELDGTIHTWSVGDGNSKWELAEVSDDSIKLINKNTDKSYSISF